MISKNYFRFFKRVFLKIGQKLKKKKSRNFRYGSHEVFWVRAKTVEVVDSTTPGPYRVKISLATVNTIHIFLTFQLISFIGELHRNDFIIFKFF